MSVGTRRNGIVLLNQRINYYDGYPPPVTTPEENRPWSARWGQSDDWHVVRHQPKTPTWAASTHGRGTVRHLIRYQLVATHRITGVVVKITRWACGARCYSDLQTEGLDDKKRCWTCRRFTKEEIVP